MFHGKLSQAMHYDNTLSNTQRRDCRGFKQAVFLSRHPVKQGWECLLKFPSKQLVIKTPCQTGIGVIVEISKEAVPPAPMLSEEDTGHLATSQASLSSRECCICVLSQSGHLPHWIGAQLGNGKLSSWNPKSFPGSGSISGCLKKCELFWERNAKPRNPYSSILLLPVFFVNPSVYWRNISGARLPRKCLLFQDILRPLVGLPPLAPVTST